MSKNKSQWSCAIENHTSIKKMCDPISRKWTLVVFCVLAILLNIAITIAGTYLVDQVENDTGKSQEEWKNAKVSWIFGNYLVNFFRWLEIGERLRHSSGSRVDTDWDVGSLRRN